MNEVYANVCASAFLCSMDEHQHITQSPDSGLVSRASSLARSVSSSVRYEFALNSLLACGTVSEKCLAYGDLILAPMRLPSSSETVILSFFDGTSAEDVLSRTVTGGFGFEARSEPADVGEASSMVNRESKGVGSLCSRRVNVSVQE